jgi:photosystem II stability/assembly factor-like uncharacterized protein
MNRRGGTRAVTGLTVVTAGSNAEGKEPSVLQNRLTNMGIGLVLTGVLAGACGRASGQVWVQQSPFPTSQYIYDLAFTSPTHGFVVGTWRALVETQDGGATWTQRMGAGLNGEPFYRITFFDAQRGFVFGNNNDAWRTINGGATWTQMTSMLAGSWYHADFTSPMFGVAACNGAGAYTTNGGVSWNLLQGYPDSPFFSAIDMRDSSVGLAGGSTTFNSDVRGVLRTTNGGLSWTLVHEGYVSNVMWLDNTTALAFLWNGVSGSAVLRSTDAGLTWQPWGDCPDDVLDKVARIDADTLVGVVHAVGTVYRSTDGGRSWPMVMPGQGVGNLPPMAPWSFSFPDPDHGYLGGPAGMLFFSGDRGASWTQRSRGVGEAINGLDMVNNQLGFAVTDYHTLRTTDGGAHWLINHRPQVTGQVFGRDERATCVSAVDDQFIVVAGQGGIAFRTTDGGESWQSIGWPASMHEIFSANDVQFTDHSNGWVVGSGDTYGLYPSVYRTSDGGNTWAEGSPQTLPRALYSAVDFTDPLHGWMATASRVVYRTTNGGDTWTPATIASDFLTITDMDFAQDGLTGFVIGFYGEVFRTTNGGVTWTNVFIDPNYNERALGISVVTPQKAYYTVFNNSTNTQYLRSTTNGGSTWTVSPFPAPWIDAYLRANRIEVLPSGRAFVGGHFGLIAAATLWACPPDFNGDGDTGTDADIEAFFACLAGNCCPACGSADFNGDGDSGTDADIESFFRVLAGGSC